ncbi:glutamate receptor 2.1-like [Lotus japonicus]|uniref:glutamate receptor 2.1-like n=1 Tax=Lotus japonicus TaxID=34305 RepID=UPI002589A0BA|nr:glutamate receptor 2.1-like [Lotus japonicus]
MVKNNFIKFVYSLIIFYSWSLSFMIMGMAQRNETVMVKVGGVIDLTGMVGKMGLSCINMSLSDFYLSHPHYNTRIQFSFRDSHGDVVTAAAQALELIQNEQVQAILGPVTTMEANFMIHLGDKAHVPIITFSATSPSLSMLKSPYFFQIAHNDLAQVNAITSMVQAFGWKQVVPIYVDNSFGEGLIPSLTISLQQAYIRVLGNNLLGRCCNSWIDEDVDDGST